MFGGSYLLLFLIGMCLEAQKEKRFFHQRHGREKLILFLILSWVWLIWMIKKGFVLDNLIPLGDTSAVPGITLILYGILILGVFYWMEPFLHLCGDRVESLLSRIFKGGGEYRSPRLEHWKIQYGYLFIPYPGAGCNTSFCSFGKYMAAENFRVSHDALCAGDIEDAVA